MTLRKVVEKSVLPAIYYTETKSGPQPVFDGSIEHIRGESQIIIPLPGVKIRGKDRHFVLKVPVHPVGQRILPGLPKSHVMLYSTIKVGMQEGSSDLLRRKGIPAPAHHSIGIARGLTGNLVQDLRDFGEIHEADDFDFESVPNGAKLKQEFDQHVASMQQMQKDGQINPERHRENPERPYQRAFLVAQPPGRKHSVLLAGDLDNFYMTERSKDSDHIAARNIENGLFDEFMKAMDSRKRNLTSTRYGPVIEVNH